MDEYKDIFLDTDATKEAVILTDSAIFQYIYHGPDVHWVEFGTPCSQERDNRTHQTEGSVALTMDVH